MKETGISVLTLRDYGHMELRLKEQMDARGMSRGKLARAVDTRFEVIDKWYKGSVEKLDLDILARICFALDCEPSDLLVYVPGEKEK